MNAFFGHHAVSMHACTISPCRRATSLRRGEREEEHTRIVVLRLFTGESVTTRETDQWSCRAPGPAICSLVSDFTLNRFS